MLPKRGESYWLRSIAQEIGVEMENKEVSLYRFRIDRGEKIAEIGGGRGELTLTLLDKGVNVKIFMEPGTKVEGLMLPIEVKKINKSVGEEQCGKLIAEDEVNTIIMQDVIEHIAEIDLKNMLAEYRQITGRLPRMIGRTPNLKSRFGLRNSFGDNTHIHRFTDRSLMDYLENLGYNNINIKKEPYAITGLVSFIRYLPYALVMIAEGVKMLIVFGQWERNMTPNIVFDASQIEEEI